MAEQNQFRPQPGETVGLDISEPLLRFILRAALNRRDSSHGTSSRRRSSDSSDGDERLQSAESACWIALRLHFCARSASRRLRRELPAFQSSLRAWR